MISVKSRKNLISKLLYRRLVALTQLLVMVMLAVPAYCYEEAPDCQDSLITLAAETNHADQDSCPCCPQEEGQDSDNCSNCSYCSYYAPLSWAPSFRYVPSVAELTFPEPFSKLSDVDIPIFVPPQNLS